MRTSRHGKSALRILGTAALLGLSGVAAWIPLWSTPAFAADEDEREADDEWANTEEIFVNARKRKEALQKVPISVTAFTETRLEELDTTDATAISFATPNLMINRTASGSAAVVSCMRGMCRTDTTLTDDPYVGIYLNGVYTGKAIGSVTTLADIDQIEVLRGPQGTIFGKNTIGGAVNVRTRKPSGEAGVKLDFEAGTDTTTNFRALVDLPRTGDLSVKLGYLTKQHEPYVTNYIGSDLQDENKHAFMADFLVEPSKDFYAEVVVDWMRQREQPAANFPTAGVFDPVGPPPNFLGNPAGLRTGFDRHVTLYEEAGEGTKNDVDAGGLSLTMGYTLPDVGPAQNLALKSITAHRRFRNAYNVNAGGQSIRNLWTQDRFNTQNTSTELQLSGEIPAAFDLQLLVGFFYMNEQGDYQNWQGYMAGPPFVAGTFSDLVTRTGIEYNSYAVYTEETVHFFDDLALSFGVRFTQEERDADHAYEVYNADGFAPGSGVGFIAAASWSTETGGGLDAGGMPSDTTFSSSTFSPRLTISYQLIEEMMLFGGWARGFKSGGFNARSIDAFTWNPYDDEMVDSFEAGFKTDVWDHRIQLNATGFIQLVKDAQLQFNRLTAAGFEVILSNAGDAMIYGGEIEAAMRIGEGLDIRFNVALAETVYDEVINPWTGIDEKDQRHPALSPEATWGINLRWKKELEEVGMFVFQMDYFGSAEVGFNTLKSIDDIVGQDDYDLLNLRIGIEDIEVGENARFAIMGVGKNLTSVDYRIGGYGASIPTIGFWYTNVYDMPRYFGVEVNLKWGSAN